MSFRFMLVLRSIGAGASGRDHRLRFGREVPDNLSDFAFVSVEDRSLGSGDAILFSGTLIGASTTTVLALMDRSVAERPPSPSENNLCFSSFSRKFGVESRLLNVWTMYE